MTKYLLNRDSTMIQVMETDLVNKIITAYDSLDGLKANVQGVFDLQQLERIMEGDLAKGIAVGVGYFDATNSFGKRPGPNGNVDGNNRFAMVEFRFLVILALCDTPGCPDRYSATQLLSVNRMAIDGAAVEGDSVQRKWTWVSERPEISASSKDILYYSQLWQLSMPNNGNLA